MTILSGPTAVQDSHNTWLSFRGADHNGKSLQKWLRETVVTNDEEIFIPKEQFVEEEGKVYYILRDEKGNVVARYRLISKFKDHRGLYNADRQNLKLVDGDDILLDSEKDTFGAKCRLAVLSAFILLDLSSVWIGFGLLMTPNPTLFTQIAGGAMILGAYLMLSAHLDELLEELTGKDGDYTDEERATLETIGEVLVTVGIVTRMGSLLTKSGAESLRETAKIVEKETGKSVAKDTGKTAVKEAVKKSGKSSGKNAAYEAALSGGKHAGTLRNYSKRSAKEIQKAIAGYEKQVALHRQKIAEPAKHAELWDGMTEKARAGLIRKWEKDLARNQELADVLRGLLDSMK